MVCSKQTLTTILLVILAIGLIVGYVSADSTVAQFSGLGSNSNIYSRYYSGNVIAGILKMQIPPGNNVPPSPYDSYCIDLFKPIQIGNTLIADGDLAEAQQTRPDQLVWCQLYSE